MLRAIIKKELLGHLVSFRLIFSTCMMLILALLAARVGTEDYRDRHDSYVKQVDQHAQNLSDVTVYSYLQPVVTRAPEALSVLDRGFDARLGTEVRVNLFTIPKTASAPSPTSQRVSSLGDLSLDLTTIVTVILGLLALLLTFDAVCSERERGTLQLILTNDVARSTILAGKFLGALVALMMPLIGSLLITLWALVGSGGVNLASTQWQRVLGLLGAYVLYLCVMLLFGLVTSLAARRSSTALAVSLLIWLVTVFLVPQLAVTVATRTPGTGEAPASPGPTIAAVLEAGDEELRKLGDAAAVKPPKKSQDSDSDGAIRLRFGTRSYYEALAAYYSRQNLLGMRYAIESFAAGNAANQHLRRMEDRARFLASLSPAYLLARLSESLAGTSVADHDAFLERSRAVREVVVEYLQRQGALDSWRWFTDDDPANLQPQAELKGAAMEKAGSRFSEADFERQLHDRKESMNASSRLNLDALPSVPSSSLGLQPAVRRVLLELVSLLIVNGLLAVVACRQFLGYRPK